MTQDELADKVGEIADDTRQIKTVLLGVPDTDDKGLCGVVKCHDKRLESNERNFWLLVGFLVGTGTLAGAAALTNVLTP